MGLDSWKLCHNRDWDLSYHSLSLMQFSFLLQCTFHVVFVNAHPVIPSTAFNVIQWEFFLPSTPAETDFHQQNPNRSSQSHTKIFVVWWINLFLKSINSVGWFWLAKWAEWLKYQIPLLLCSSDSNWDCAQLLFVFYRLTFPPDGSKKYIPTMVSHIWTGKNNVHTFFFLCFLLLSPCTHWFYTKE